MKSFTLAAFVATTSATLPQLTVGECPSTASINGMGNVDESAYAGMWYEYERQMSPLPWWMGYSMMDDMGQCGTQEIESTPEGLIVNYKLKMMWPMGWMGSPRMATTITNEGVQLTEFDKPLDWVFDESDDKHFSYVLDTDYDNYAAVYMCADGSEKMDMAIQVVYVYVRDPSYTLSDSVRAAIDAKVQAIVPSYDSGDSYYPVKGDEGFLVSCDYENSQAAVDAYYAEKMDEEMM